VVLIVIVVVVIGAYYLTLGPSSGGTTTSSSRSSSSISSTPPTSTTSTVTSTTTASSTLASSTTSSSASATVGSTSRTSSQSASSTTSQTLTANCPPKTQSNSTTIVLALLPWLQSYPSLTLSFAGKTSTMSSNHTFTLSYSVAYVTSTTYKVDLTYTATKSHQFTAWLLKNGTALAIYNAQTQVNETGAQASSDLQSNFGEFASIQGFLEGQSMYSNLFRSTGFSTVTIGTQSLTVTNYVTNALPETIQLCNGETDTLTAYNLSEGTPSGASFELPVYVNIAGTATADGTTTPFAFTVEITAFTVS
jgi:hypothetical protein